MCKNAVHPAFSTSFGLHVAVLTADKPQKLIFARRANRGMVKLTFAPSCKGVFLLKSTSIFECSFEISVLDMCEISFSQKCQ